MKINVLTIDYLEDKYDFNALLDYFNNFNEFIYKNTALVLKINFQLDKKQINFIKKKFDIEVQEVAEKETILAHQTLYYTNKNFEITEQKPKKIFLKENIKNNIAQKNISNPAYAIDNIQRTILTSFANTKTNFLIATDKNGNILYFNDTFAEKFSLKEDSINKNYTNFIFPDDTTHIHKTIWNLLHNIESVVILEAKYENLSDKVDYIKWEFFPIRDTSLNIIGLHGIGQDITMQKLNENKLFKEKNFLNTIINSGNLGVWEWDIDNDKIVFNQKWTQILGFNKHLWTFEEWQTIIYKEDRASVVDILQKVQRGELDFYEVEHRKVTKDGTIKWILLTGKGIEKNEKGQCSKIIGIHQDITEKKEREILLKILEDRNKNILDNMEEGLVIQDIDGKIISCNHSAEKILGLTFDQMLGKTSIDEDWYAIKENGENFDGIDHPAMVALRTKTSQKNVIMGVHQSKKHFVWIAINSNLLTYPDTDEVYAVFSVFNDITDIKKMEISLRNSQQKYKKIIETQTDFVLLSQPDTTIQFVNESLSKVMNISIEKMIGMKWSDLAYVNDDNEIKQKIASLTPENNSFSMENRFKANNGEWIWTQWLNQGFFDEFNKLVQIQSVGRDITILKEAQDEISKKNEELAASEEEIRVNLEEMMYYQDQLQKSELKLKAILNSTNDINILSDRSLQILSFNNSAKQFIEKIKNQFIKVGDNLLYFFNNEIIESFEENLQQAINGAIVTNEFVMNNDNNEPVYFLVKYYPVKDDDNNFVGVSLNLVDISNIKKVENEINQQKKRFQDVVDSTNGIVWEADVQTFQFRYVSQKTEQLFGYTTEEWYAPDFWVSHLYPNDKEMVINTFLADKNLGSYDMEYRFIDKKGAYVWIRDIGKTVVGDDNLPILRGIMIDITEEKAAKNKIILYNNKLTQLKKFIDESADAIQVADKEGNFIYINKIASERLGINVDEIEQYNINDFEYVFQQVTTWDEYLKDLKQKQIIIKETININQKTGNFFPVELIIKHISLEHDDYVMVISRDITSRKTLEKEKEDLLKRLEETTKHVPGYIYQFCLRKDGTSYFPYVSDGITQLLNIQPETLQINAQNLYKYALKEDITVINNSLITSIRKLSNWKVEWRSRTEDGKIIWIESNSSPQKLENGDIIWYGYANNITQRKTMEEELKNLSLVAKKTSNAVVITDIHKKIMWANEGFTRITGYTLEEVLGKTPGIFQFEKTDKQTVIKINECIEKQIPAQFEILNKGKYGNIYWLYIDIQPLLNDKNKLIGFMAMQTDITERKEREKKINEQNTILRKIAFVQSHTLRRPIANILGLINLLKEEDKNTETFDSYLKYLEKSAKETDEVIYEIVEMTNEIENIDNE